jgi:2Fe-2S ferredoxin
MPKVSFVKSHLNSFEVSAGENLMKALFAQGIPVASSCKGDGVCSKCKVKVVTGALNLSGEKVTETILKAKNLIASSDRISCQCEVLGDVTIDTGYW